MTNPHTLALAICGYLIGFCSIATADLIVSHNGSTDPTTEGWTALPGSGGVSVGPVNDGGTTAWFVDDNSTADGSIYFYEHVVGAADIAIGTSNGWSLATTMRVAADEELSFDGSPFVGYRDGITGWEMEISLNPSGDTVVRLYTGVTTGPTHTISGSSTYNTFDLRYDPIASSADLFLNGNEVISDYAGFANSDTRVLWGAGRSPDRGQGNFNSVSFSTVPEPSSLVAFLLLMAFGYSRRNGR